MVYPACAPLDSALFIFTLDIQSTLVDELRVCTNAHASSKHRALGLLGFGMLGLGRWVEHILGFYGCCDLRVEKGGADAALCNPP